MDQFLKSLTTRSRMLEAELAAERSNEVPDGARLMALKRLKRQVGVQISYIRREGRQIAEVMVVRKPRRCTDLMAQPLR
ncbi:MAG: hypothetical protein B7Z15_15280 [Rhizobiales bacterium 32-66-8]|nr:MAG: hypothetical protein B7Z45_06855 [Azorhizobium sp. 12-66-6]OYX08166.1 MAG: hypothetical protein B7Z15_15280 [Rhizobiales bacterium 32-66-8]